VWLLVVAVVAVFAMAGSAYAAEHPMEHPSEHPSAGGKAPAVTADQIAATVNGLVWQDSKLKGGYFLIYDGKKKEVVALSLVRIHKDKISMLTPDKCFVCADFKTPAGKMYDLDFFVSHPGGRNLHVSEIMIHKEAGAARYNWVKQGGTWVRK
jgi:hypothetical protein